MEGMGPHPRHLTRQILRAARHGEIDDGRLIELLLGHLEEVCPECSGEIAAEAEGEIPLTAYRETVRRVQRSGRVQRARKEMQEAAREVPALVEGLRGLSAGQRLLLVRNAPERYVHPLLVEALFAEARSCLPADPEGSLSWAETAEGIAELYAEPYPPHRIRALAYQANAHRAAGDFDRAQRLFRQARELGEAHEVADAELHAELHSFLGSLWTDLRHFDRAARHLDEAAELYLLLEEEEALARVYMKVGNLRASQGDLTGTLEADQAAVGLLDARTQPRLYLAARFNYAHNLVESGNLQAARNVLAEDESLYQVHADQHTLVRASWLVGRIAAAAGEWAEAEKAFRMARDHFADQEHGFNAALACLDLAALHHRAGHWDQVQEAATQAVRLFEAHEVHREALAALALVQDAARRRSLDAETLHRVMGLVQQAQREPTPTPAGEPG